MAAKKDIKTLFRSIRNGDRQAVLALLAADENFVRVCAAAPPKKDDGQSPLQVALKTGRFEIAGDLLDRGADVNHMEVSSVNTWRAPVLHDALRAAAFTAGELGFPAAIALIGRMLNAGADPNAVDSYGNSCLQRAILDAKMCLDIDPTKTSPEKVNQFALIFSTLIDNGADIHAANPRRPSSAFQTTRGSFLERFVK